MKKNSIKVFYLLLIVVFVSSLEVSKLNIPALFQRKLNLVENGVYTCLSHALPEDALAIFFSKPDGTLDYARYGEQFGFTQYELVPRLLVAVRVAPMNLEEYTWYVAFSLPAEEMNTFKQQLSVEVVQSCDEYVVLKRIP